MRNFKMHWATMVISALLLLAAPAGAEEPVPLTAPEPLAALIGEALEQNGDIRQAEESIAAARELVPYAASLDDPRVGFALLNLPVDTLRFDQEAMTQKQLFIAQKLPWFGKLELRSQRQALEVVRLRALLRGKQLELARQVATLYYDLAFVVESLEINRRLSGLVNQILRVTETRYASGMGLQQDVLQAQVEASRLIDEKISLERQRRTIAERINELLNRETPEALPPPSRLELLRPRLDAEDLYQRALSHNPWLQEKMALVDRAAVEVELARKDYWPNVDLKLAYGQRDSSQTGRDWADFVSASVAVNIPLWRASRQDRRVAAALRQREAAFKSYLNLYKGLPRRVDALVNEIHRLQENQDLYAENLMVQAEHWARSSLAAYEVGKVEFSTMIAAQLRLLRFELQTYRYLISIYQKRAELEEVIGGPLGSAAAE